jgi:hypothetical protein
MSGTRKYRVYNISDTDLGKIENAFTPIEDKHDQAWRYKQITAYARRLAYLMTTLCPPSRELSEALKNIDQAVLWARAAMERNE